MRIKRTLLPNQDGTKTWVDKYGKDLVCVRYRYDEVKNKRITTVELIVNEKVWEKNIERIPANKIMQIKVKYEEVNLRMLIKQSGGKWNTENKYWELPYSEVKALGLENRIMNKKK